MTLVYLSIFIIVLYNIKILSFNDYNENPLSMSNGNAIKGLAAILIVLHHISQRIENPGKLLFFRYIGYLQVAIFLFFSGYGLMKSYKSKKGYLEGFWKKRIPKIVIPFILANILFLAVYRLVLHTKFSMYEIITCTLGLRLIDGFKWYVIAIIVLYVGFYLTFKYLKENLSIFGIFLVVTSYNYICFKLGQGEWWYNATYCFLIGIIFANYEKYLINIIRKYYLIVTTILLTSFIYTFISNIHKSNIYMAMISSILFVLVCPCILMKCELNSRILKFLGGISYEIYLVHRMFLDILMGMSNKYLYLLICISMSILLAYLFSIFSKKIVNTYIFLINSNRIKTYDTEINN
ncbi:acyltransferase family protein [Peptacetobacter sp.]|uniref:acyltransferase family protein n=1 Tax=Peptacetobacter sp. TaxID=2991975 RepID=UPI0026190B97|nr:acyltransferase [Peptacetobacter sp.]